ncbi:MAG: TRAP transporter small permease subunit [Chloroflexi bacterium]|nr:TRAP transporter small permease subunit [Chloroflexota bacterium]
MGLTLALAAMVLLPLAEIVLRSTLRVGITGCSSLVQHLTLVVGMLGGALAARERGLLSLSTVTAFLKGRWKGAAKLFSGSFAAAITFLLCQASVRFVLSEKVAGSQLAYGLPLWIVQLILPLGFALVMLRLLWQAAESWKGRAFAALLAAAVVLMRVWAPFPVTILVPVALVALLTATVLGAPVFVTLGGAAVILFWGKSMPLASIPLTHYQLVTDSTLPTIPLFTLAGYFLAEGGASRRLIRVPFSIAT